MPVFPARRSPTLVQRLGDQRRALALVGLAAAAVVGARAARRRGAGTAPDYAPATPAPPVASPPPVAPVSPVAPDPVPPAVEKVAEPNTEEFAAAELAVLAILSQEGRLETDRTSLTVATTLERETVEVAALLRKLKEQGHVAGERYTATGERIWNVTPAGTARLD